MNTRNHVREERIIMAVALPVSTKTIFVEAIVGEDGSLHLDSLAPAFTPGARVLLTIAPIAETTPENTQPLVGTVTRYHDPFGPATPPSPKEALWGC
jgi:hypothetical protein